MKNYKPVLFAVMLLAALFAPPVARASDEANLDKQLLNFTILGSTTQVTMTNIQPNAGNFPAFFVNKANRDFTLQVDITGTNAGTANVTFRLAPSVDGYRFGNTAPTYRDFIIPMAGATTVCVCTNFSWTNWPGAKFIGITQIVNAHTASLGIKVQKGGFQGSPAN